ncbi:MAG: hypothetical protein IKJ58_05035 [Akkermansia sp.]|nr:hypothetical protein [Akkermansia sp.]
MTSLRNRLRWPEAEWDVSGAFAKDAVLLRFHDFCREHLGYAPFAVVHGSPLFRWNCGRVLSMLMRSETEINTAAAGYVKRGIPVDLTFTNPLLREEDMKNMLGNRLLSFFAAQSIPKVRHAVIIGSEALYAHVKTNYPQLNTVSSILRITCDGGKGQLDSYLRLAERYDKVMIHPDDVFNFDLLEKLEDKGRYELILNEYCMRNCPMRAFHYTTMAEQAFDIDGYDTTKFYKALSRNGCSSTNAMLADPAVGVAALTTPEIDRLYEMGFRKFKLQGRAHPNALPLINDLLRFMLPPGEAQETLWLSFCTAFLESFTPLTVEA